MNEFYIVTSTSRIDANRVMFVSILANLNQSIIEFYLN